MYSGQLYTDNDDDNNDDDNNDNNDGHTTDKSWLHRLVLAFRQKLCNPAYTVSSLSKRWRHIAM